MVLGVVLVVLVVLSRSLVAPLLLLGTVVLSYFTILGATWLGFDRLWGVSAVDTQTGLFGFLVAPGVDYTILLVSRMREETARLGHRDGTLYALSVGGPRFWWPTDPGRRVRRHREDPGPGPERRRNRPEVLHGGLHDRQPREAPQTWSD